MTTSPAVRVKSHFFDLFLTQKRLILTQPDFPDASPVEILFRSVSSFSRTDTPEGDPSLSVTIVSGERERTMVLAFDGSGGFRGADERDRVAELVRGMVGETTIMPPVAPAAPGPSALQSDASREMTTPIPRTEMPAPPVPEIPVVSGLKADHIIVKGHEFIASLTPETISLVRHDDPNTSPLTVKRGDITGVLSKVSAGGDPSLHLRVRATGGTERTMVLVFSEWYSGGRAQERDAWTEALMDTATISEMPPATKSGRPVPAGRGASGAVSPQRPSAPGAGGGQQKFCTECGAPLSGSPRFCPNCGTPLSGGSAAGGSAGGIHELPFDAAAEDERSVKIRKPKQKREKPEKSTRQPKTQRKAGFRFRSQEQGLSEVPFIEKLLGFPAAPGDAFRYTKNDSFGQAAVYLAIILAIFATVSSIVLHLFAASLDAAEYPQMAALGTDIVAAALLIPRIVILGIVFIIIWSLLMHILLRIFGQSDSAGETFRTCAYAATPFGTVGLIPFFGPPIAALWTLFLVYKGLVAANDVEEKFALLAVAVPVILGIAIFYLFFSAGGSQS